MSVVWRGRAGLFDVEAVVSEDQGVIRRRVHMSDDTGWAHTELRFDVASIDELISALTKCKTALVGSGNGNDKKKPAGGTRRAARRASDRAGDQSDARQGADAD
jgi:hypothetical protein